MYVTRVLFSICLLTLSACDKVLGPGNETELASEAESSCGFVQNSYGQRVSWQNPEINLLIDPDFSTDMESALKDAIAVLETALQRKLFSFEKWSSASALVPRLDGKNGIFIVKDWPNNSSKTQAVTNLYYTGKSVTEADIKINTRHYEYFFNPESNHKSQVHLSSLFLHELGHALGLQHSSQLPTVMWPILEYDLVRLKLSEKDQENLKCEY